MDKREFAKVTELIAALFPKEGITFSKPSAEAWYNALKDLDYEDVTKGLTKYAQENPWSPSIADIRKYTPEKSIMSEEVFRRIIEAHRGPDEW